MQEISVKAEGSRHRGGWMRSTPTPDVVGLRLSIRCDGEWGRRSPSRTEPRATPAAPPPSACASCVYLQRKHSAALFLL